MERRRGITTSDLIRAEAQGLDVNRLVFVIYLLDTGRINDSCSKDLVNISVIDQNYGILTKINLLPKRRP